MDASAGIEIALDKESAAKFHAELEDPTIVISSDFYKVETANVIWKYFKANLLNKEEALRILRLCNNLMDEYVDIASNNKEALVECMRLNHPAYDLFYLTLARRRGGVLFRLDKKLIKLAIEKWN